jgi:superfamily II DNA or RNA helicase
MLSFFKSRNLMKHINGIPIKPPVPTEFPPHYTPSDDEEMRYEKAEDRLEKYLAREGMVKTQVITSVSESLALMLHKKGNAKDLWEALTDEMMKNPKMVVTSLKRQLRNMKCSEDDDLHEHLDKSQDPNSYEHHDYLLGGMWTRRKCRQYY